jgi:N-acyl-L-homoserine lactone synthetase
MTTTLDLAHDGFHLEHVLGGHKEQQLMRFRHRVFREQLRWLPESADGLDRDEYDPFSDNYAVLSQNQVVGSVRMTPGDCPFMIEHEFLPLLPAGWTLEKSHCSAEITRFAVGIDQYGRRPESAARLLYLSLYQWAQVHQVQLMYFVVEPPFFRHIKRLGFPAFAIGDALPLDGGVLSQAGYLDWGKADPLFIRWLRSVTEVPALSQLQSRASDYLH